MRARSVAEPDWLEFPAHRQWPTQHAPVPAVRPDPGPTVPPDPGATARLRSLDEQLTSQVVLPPVDSIVRRAANTERSRTAATAAVLTVGALGGVTVLAQAMATDAIPLPVPVALAPVASPPAGTAELPGPTGQRPPMIAQVLEPGQRLAYLKPAAAAPAGTHAIGDGLVVLDRGATFDPDREMVWSPPVDHDDHNGDGGQHDGDGHRGNDHHDGDGHRDGDHNNGDHDNGGHHDGDGHGGHGQGNPPPFGWPPPTGGPRPGQPPWAHPHPLDGGAGEPRLGKHDGDSIHQNPPVPLVGSHPTTAPTPATKPAAGGNGASGARRNPPPRVEAHPEPASRPIPAGQPTFTGRPKPATQHKPASQPKPAGQPKPESAGRGRPSSEGARTSSSDHGGRSSSESSHAQSGGHPESGRGRSSSGAGHSGSGGGRGGR